jgi:hypothetical protein
MEAFLMEKTQLKMVMEPVDLNTAAITGTRVAMAKGARIAFLVMLGASLASTVQLTLRQHTAAAGGTSQDLSVKNLYFKKVGAATSFTKVEPTVAAAMYDLSVDFSTVGGMVVLEVLSEDLDNENGYTHVSLDIADAGAAKIGAAAYVMSDMRYAPAYDQVI